MNIVFIHFGAKLPKHLRLNLERTILLFPTQKIFLISDKAHLNLPNLVSNFVVNLDSESSTVMSQLHHPMWFRENFWFSTLRRFLVFSDFMKVHSGPLIHVESDVVLAGDFPLLNFQKLEKTFAFPLISESQGIPSILYIRNNEGADQLRKLTISEASQNPGTTDMLILRKLLDEKPGDVFVLPGGPRTITCYRPDTSNAFLNMQNLGWGLVGGVIDGAAIGQYLAGDDPRNNRGIRNIYVDSKYSSLLPSQMNLKFSPTRNFIDFDVDGMDSPVYCLHIHSKDLNFFKAESFSKILQKRIRNLANGPTRELLFPILCIQAFKAAKRRFVQLSSRVSK